MRILEVRETVLTLLSVAVLALAGTQSSLAGDTYKTSAGGGVFTSQSDALAFLRANTIRGAELTLTGSEQTDDTTVRVTYKASPVPPIAGDWTYSWRHCPPIAGYPASATTESGAIENFRQFHVDNGYCDEVVFESIDSWPTPESPRNVTECGGGNNVPALPAGLISLNNTEAHFTCKRTGQTDLDYSPMALRMQRSVSGCTTGHIPADNGLECEVVAWIEIIADDDPPADGGDSCDKPKAGNPCNPITGNKFERAIDIAPSSTGLSFVRYYNSLSYGIDMGLGGGWSHSYSIRLRTTDMRLTMADGEGIPLIESPTGSGQWTPGSNYDFTLVESGTEFLLKFDGGEQWLFDADGRLTEQVDVSGRIAEIAYSSSDPGAPPTQISGPFGHVLSFGYTADLLTSVTDANGDVFNYTYDTQGRLETVTDPLNVVRTYHYEDAYRHGLLTGISDENGDRYANFGYDEEGRSVSNAHAISENTSPQEAITLSYDEANQKTTVTDSAGNQTVYEYSENNGRHWLEKQIYPDGKSRVWTRDPDTDRVTSFRDENYKRTDYTYNATGQRTQATEAPGTGKERTTTYEYQSPVSDVVTKITRPSVAAGKQAETVFAYNDTNHPYLPTLIKQSGFGASGEILSDRYTEITYSQSGQVTSVDVSGKNNLDRSILTYYDCATGAECGQLQSVSNSLGHETIYDIYDEAGRVLQITDPNDLESSFTYDGRGRVLTRIQQPLTGPTRTTTYIYDSLGQLLSVTDPKGLVYEYVYDAAHDLQEVWTKKTNGAVYARVEYDYDTRGNRTAERVYNAGGGLATDQTMVYDLRDRLAEIEAAITSNSASLTQRVYDAIGSLKTETDPNQSAIEQGGGEPLTEEHSYDALNRLFKTVDELGGVTQTWYTVADDIAQVRAPNGATTVYETDDFGNRTKEVSPDRGETTYTYKVWGDIQSQTDARDQQVNYIYDSLKRLKTIGYGTSDNINFTYDNCTGGIGRVCKVVDKSGVTNYQYDAFGNVTRVERRIDGVWYNTVYTYDAQDQISTVTYPSGRRITYLRDKAGRVFRVRQRVGGVETDVVTGRGYRGDNQFITQTLGNGLKETRKYDLQGRMFELKLADGGTTVYFRHFDYDASGNVTARKVDASLNNPVYDGSFGYDVLDRLTSEDQGTQWQSPVPGEPVLYPTTFGYTDPDGTGWKTNNGNRRQMTRNGTTTNLSYPNNSNRLTNDGGQSLSYDAAGNQTGKGTESWVYDPRGLISQYRQSGSTVAAYSYDYRSLRSKKAVTNAETVVFLYDLQGQLIAEYEDGGLKREYVWLDGAPLAQIDTGESITWFTTDHLFTPRLGTDSSKESVWQWDSYAFGETEPFQPTGSSGTMPTVKLRFPGQYFDDESGSYYNWHRYYESNTGRYIASDPIGISGGFNTYLYVGANSLIKVDPYGLVEYPDDFVGPIPQNGYYSSDMTVTWCGRIPPAPPGANIFDNMSDASNSWNPDWLYKQVQGRGNWDYKQFGGRYEDFGNFNYGAVFSAFGVPNEIALRGAGWANQKADPGRTHLGKPWWKEPFGDDPADQSQIRSGQQFCECSGY